VNRRDLVWIAAAGALFTCGLALAGATSPGIVLDGFRFDAGWDPRVWLMFAGTQLASIPLTRWLARRGRTLRGARMRVLPSRPIDARLVAGSLVFGAGWGLTGICPGPSFATVASGSTSAVLVFAGIVAGIALHDFTRGA
jgi:uncharacterized protein